MNSFERIALEYNVDHQPKHAPGVMRILDDLAAENRQLKSKLLRAAIKTCGDLHTIKLMQEENRRMKRQLDSAQLGSMFKNQAV